jgi:hypothetical protein
MNRKYFPALLLAAFFSIAFFSCKKGTDKYSSDNSRGYFPLRVGHYVVYDVDSTIWDDFAKVKTLHRYQMRYTIADTFTDNEKRLSYRIDVHIRPNDTLTWATHRVINVTPTNTTLEYSESNIRFIKLVFPVMEGKTWKGNSLIAAADQDYQYLQNWDYRYYAYEAPFNNGKVLFGTTLTVLQADEKVNDPETMPDAYASRTYGREVYGFNVGLVYRELTYWTYQPSIQYRNGYSVIMRAVDHN